MNFKQVLKAYGILRSLTDDESALLETLRAMNDTERDLLVETLSPAKMSKKPAKKSSSRSSRASGMAAAIGNSLRQKRSARGSGNPDDPDYDPNAYCQKEFEGGLICDEPADANVHHLRGATGYHEFQQSERAELCVRCGASKSHYVHSLDEPDNDNYHEFVAGKLSAQGAGGRSSTNGAGSGSIPSSGDVTANAGDARSASGD